jgi:hypothetical protein
VAETAIFIGNTSAELAHRDNGRLALTAMTAGA